MTNPAMAANEATTIIDDRSQPWLPVAVPGAEGTFLKVLVADEENDQVVIKFKFSPGSALPRHFHNARAIAYTISGKWEYDEGPFEEGMMAYEDIGNLHTPSSKYGAELFIIMTSDGSGKFLINYMPDGSEVRFNMRFFKALVGLSLEKASTLNMHDLVD